MSAEIRNATWSDEKYFIKVYKEAYKGLEEYAYTSRRDVKWYFRWLMKRDPQGFYTYIVEEPVGFIACDCNWFSVFEGEEVAEIHEIVVHPDWQNKGIGTALMNKALEYAKTRKRRIAELWVGLKNTRAINFYKKFNFREVGVVGRWIRMVKHL